MFIKFGEGKTVAGLPIATALFYATIFVVGFCFYVKVWPNAPVMEPDSGGYFRAAVDLSDFRIDHLQYRGPGYPVVLLLTRADQKPRILFIVGLLLHFAVVWILGALLYQASINRGLNLFGFILLLPPFVEPAGFVLSENLAEGVLAVVLVSLFVWHQQRRPIWILLSGIAVGYVALTRPTYQLLSIALTVYMWVMVILFPSIAENWKSVAKGSAVLLLGSAVIIGGYAYINYRSVGYFGITPKLGLTLSLKTLRVIERLPNEYAAIRQVLIEARNKELVESAEHTGHMYIWGLEPELTRLTGLEQPDLSRYMLKLNLSLIQKAPLTYLQEVFWAIGSYGLPLSRELANFNSRVLQAIWAFLHFVILSAFALSSMLLVSTAVLLRSFTTIRHVVEKPPFEEVRMFRLQLFLQGAAFTIIIYTAAVSCLVEIGDPRYRVPTDVIIVFMVFLGYQMWQKLVRYFTLPIIS